MMIISAPTYLLGLAEELRALDSLAGGMLSLQVLLCARGMVLFRHGLDSDSQTLCAYDLVGLGRPREFAFLTRPS